MATNKSMIAVVTLTLFVPNNSLGFQEIKDGMITIHGLRGPGAESLVHECKGVENVDLDKMAVPAKDAMGVGLCLGYIAGISDVDRVDAVAKQNRMCVPDNASGAQLAKVIVKYGDDHPEELNEPGAIFVTLAMKKAFPCR